VPVAQIQFCQFYHRRLALCKKMTHDKKELQTVEMSNFYLKYFFETFCEI